MAEPQLVGPVPPSTAPAVQTTQGRAARELPADILHQASRRLQIVALTMSAMYPVGHLLGRAFALETFGADLVSGRMMIADLVVAASVAVSMLRRIMPCKGAHVCPSPVSRHRSLLVPRRLLTGPSG